MGGSGEGAREAVSMSTHMVSVECDFAGRRFRFPSSAVQTLRARHASISGASRPALLSLCPFSKCFFGTPPPATPCDISPARMLLLTPRSCGSWFPDPRPLRASPSSCHLPLGRPLLGAPPSLAELSGLRQRPLSSRVSFYWLLPSAHCALQTCPQILHPLNPDRCLAAPVGDGRSRSRSKRPGDFRSGLLGHLPGLPRPPCKRSSCWDVGMLRSCAPAEPGGGPSRQSASSPLLCAGPVPASGDSSVTETDPKSWLSL